MKDIYYSLHEQQKAEESRREIDKKFIRPFNHRHNYIIRGLIIASFGQIDQYILRDLHNLN